MLSSIYHFRLEGETAFQKANVYNPQDSWRRRMRMMAVRGKDALLFVSLCLGARTDGSGQPFFHLTSLSWPWHMLIWICTVFVEGDTREERGHRVTLVKLLDPVVPWSTGVLLLLCNKAIAIIVQNKDRPSHTPVQHNDSVCNERVFASN